MSAHIITSVQNQRIKDAAKLRDRRQRDKQRRILIDGAREIERALTGGVNVEQAFVCERLFHTEESRRLPSKLLEAGVQTWYVTPEVFAKLAYGERADGVIAVAATPQRTLAGLHVAADALVAVLVGLEKPGNVGAVLRSADAAAVDAVIVADGGTDLFNPNAIRASLGTIFTIPVCAATTAETLAWLRARGSRIVAARVDAATDYTIADYLGPTAIVLGSEAAGLPSKWYGGEVAGVRLPMLGAADSLNVSATAAVLFYEALRQRQTGQRRV